MKRDPILRPDGSWLLPDGRVLPFVSGGEGPVATEPAPAQGAPGNQPAWQQAQVEGLPPNYRGSIYTEDDLRARIEAGRREEREKLYRDRDSEREELARLRSVEEQRVAAEAQRKSEQESAEEASRRQAEAEELDAKALIERRAQEMDARMEAQQARFEEELARRDAMLEKEREYAALEVYRSKVVAANADQILPELQDMVQGDSRAEVDASIARLVERSASVLNNFRQASEVDPRTLPGVSPRAPAQGPENLLDGQRTFSAEEMRNWSMKDYAKYRDQLPTGRSSGTGDRGLFG